MNQKTFEEEANIRFLNPSATPTWPDGTSEKDWETPNIMLKIYEKITDGEEIWYDEITEDPQGLPNAYYAVVGDNHIPLPFFFEYTDYTGLGTILKNDNHSRITEQLLLPTWAKGYIESWTVKQGE